MDVLTLSSGYYMDFTNKKADWCPTEAASTMKIVLEIIAMDVSKIFEKIRDGYFVI